ncbi:50S ribosomal protein L23 [Candidatus Micrarchaeota archaeon]|nr:50S ribosomal protein L23 [Candidatus Micrarchaeota archaeon]
MILLSPLKTEKFIQQIEFNNSIAFIVDQKATKKSVKDEVEKIFGVKVDSVRTYITPKGLKHAIVRLAKESKAEDVAAKLKLA